MDTNLDETPIENIEVAEDRVIIEQDPLKLELKDSDFTRVINKRIKESKSFFDDKYDLSNRRKKLEKYLFGRQLQDKPFKSYEAKYVDNVMWEVEQSIKPLAFSKLPDLTINPGNPSEQAKDEADKLTKVVNDDLKTRERRRVAALAFRHHPVYFVGIVKTRWDPERGKNGDYAFEAVHPENVVVDHTAPLNDQSYMDYIAECLELSVKECVMRFPDKAEDLYAELRRVKQFRDGSENDEQAMATKIKVWEVWFTWYNQKGSDYERVEGVAWKYENVVLAKMKNPNWDYKGGKRMFSYAVPGDESTKVPVVEEQLRASLLMGQPVPGLTTEQVYYNYLEQPEKPYFFIGYDQWGKMPYDETSRLEQILYLQENIDRRGKQITEMIDRNRGKHIWSKDGGLKDEDIEEMDMSNPDEDVLVNGNVGQVHEFIQPDLPAPQLFNDYEQARNRMFAKAGVEASRGEIQTDVATSNQIAREADYNRADDLVEETVNALYEWMARWSLHWIKLRYTQDHMRRLMGDDGSVIFMKLNRDLIDDGMEVTISASGTDKLKAQQRALDMANLKLIDPLNYYKDVQASDPKGRTEALMLFMQSPNLYLAKYVEGQDVPDMANALMAQQQPQPGQPGQPGMQAGGAGPEPPQLPLGAPQGPTPGAPAATPAQPPIGPAQGSVRNL